MNNTTEHPCPGKTYYVHGSGRIAVPGSRMNEIPRLKSEYYAREAERAMTLVWARIRL